VRRWCCTAWTRRGFSPTLLLRMGRTPPRTRQTVRLLLCAAAAAAAAASPPPPSSRLVYLKLSPLIGGPRALRVHSALFMDRDEGGLVGWDFVPQAATEAATLRRLLSLRAVRGERRRLYAADARGMCVLGSAAASADAAEECSLQRPTDLHLISNNCWAHTARVASVALGTTSAGAAWALLRSAMSARVAVDGSAAEAKAATARPPVKPDPTAAALSREKARRFGRDLASFLSDEDALQSARAAAAFEAALRAEEEARAAGERSRRSPPWLESLVAASAVALALTAGLWLGEETGVLGASLDPAYLGGESGRATLSNLLD